MTDVAHKMDIQFTSENGRNSFKDPSFPDVPFMCIVIQSLLIFFFIPSNNFPNFFVIL